jgi:hypothetical protein
MSGTNPNQQNTALELTFWPTETVTVIDLAHPLHGRTLPLLGVTNKPYVGRACVVWIQPGVERIVPLAATTLAGVTPTPWPWRVSVAALRTLLTVAAALPELQVEAPRETHNRDTGQATAASLGAMRRSAAAAADCDCQHPAAGGVEDPEPARASADPHDLAPGHEGAEQ